MSASFDRFSRRREDLAANFSQFAEVHCPQVEGWLYQAFCRGVAGDRTLLEIAARALEVSQEDPPEIVKGDASVSLGKLIEEAPPGRMLCVYGTHTLYQFPHDALLATFKQMQEASADRTVHFLSVEGTGGDCSELYWTVYENERRRTRLLARCNPHGRWVEWLA